MARCPLLRGAFAEMRFRIFSWGNLGQLSCHPAWSSSSDAEQQDGLAVPFPILCRSLSTSPWPSPGLASGTHEPHNAFASMASSAFDDGLCRELYNALELAASQLYDASSRRSH